MNEQRRIVAKLEALQARSRRAREALDAVPPLLEKLRQSILAAAFRGDLTKDWRAKQKDIEPATELLKRIRTERRQKWEAAELAKLKSKGKAPADDRWKTSYKEPAPLDATGLPELPRGWCWASVGEISLVAGGLTKNAGKRKNGPETPLVSVAAVQLRRIDIEGLSSIRLDPDEGDKGELCSGDLLVVEGNGSLSHIGRVAIWNDEIPGARHQNHLIRVRPILLESTYVLEWLASPLGREAIIEQATSATGLYTLSISKIDSLPIPIAPRAEQAEITSIVQRDVRRVTSLSSGLDESVQTLNVLERSVLAKAFRGELVPQDPNDEPAEAMLARARATNGSAPTNGTPPKRGRPRAAPRAESPND